MIPRAVARAVVAALLLSVPLAVLGQEPPSVVAPGSPDLPVFLGGSGKPIPANAVEVVQAEPGASRASRSGSPVPLENSRGAVLSPVDGDLYSGPCELAVKGGASFVLPAKSRARAVLEKDGSITLVVVEGSVYGANREVTVMIRAGSGITCTSAGRFLGVTAADVRTDGRWIGFSGEGGLGEIGRVLRTVTVFRDVPPAGGAVSGSKGFR